MLPLCPALGPGLGRVDRDERDVDPASKGGVDCEGSPEGDQTQVVQSGAGKPS